MTKARNFWVGYAHHIYNRGNQKEKIFLIEKDYNIFLKYLKQDCSKNNCILLAYCLMPNHYHILLQPMLGNSIPKVMQHLSSLYTNYLRFEHRWTGHVFQSRYQCKIVKTEKYLTDVLKYIKDNPVEAKIVSIPEDYKWLKIYTPGLKNVYKKEQIIYPGA